MEGTDQGAVDSHGTDVFRSAVRDLSSGGTLLVAAEGPEWLHRQCCQQLLGSPVERRLRVVGLAGSTGDCNPEGAVERLPEGATTSPEELRIVYNDLPARGAAAAETGSKAGDGPAEPSHGRGGRETGTTVLSNAPVGEFGRAIDEAIADLVGSVGGDPADGELRVCIDDVATLVDVADVATVAQFLHILGSRVTASGGLLHAHASMRTDTRAARTLAAMVDGVVSLGLRDGTPGMQWDLRDGPTSEWIPMNWITPQTSHP